MFGIGVIQDDESGELRAKKPAGEDQETLLKCFGHIKAGGSVKGDQTNFQIAAARAIASRVVESKGSCLTGAGVSVVVTERFSTLIKSKSPGVRDGCFGKPPFVGMMSSHEAFFRNSIREREQWLTKK